MQNNSLHTRSINNHGTDLCQSRNLTVRKHPKHNTQKVWASLVTGNMVLSVNTASTIGSLTCRQIIRWKKAQQVMKGKEDR